MIATTPISQIQLHPGSRITIPGVSWAKFEQILEQMGERRNTRIAYNYSTLEIMAPLPEHERCKVLLADMVKAILRIQKRPWEPLGSTTFKRQGIAGVEPDECFYIQNYQAVIGKERIDLTVDPPPDLAIESDVTSTTEINAYIALGVPELWVYRANHLAIHLLRDSQYVESLNSLIFPNLPLCDMVPQVIQRAKLIGTSQALAEFEALILQSVL
jgi:Uma2 family endonuclease